MRSIAVVTACIDALSSAGRHLFAAVRGVAFWTAIVLPMVYFPPLLLGHPLVVDPTVLGKLIGVNVVAIVVGHGHGRSSTDGFRRRS